MLRIVDRVWIEKMLQDAAKSPRRRSHFNFHESLDEPIHRLLIGAMPDTVFPIHCHPDKFETMTVLTGKIEITLYDADGKVLETRILGPNCENAAIEIPPGMFHGNKVLLPTVMLEVKPGPYVPVGPEDTLVLPQA